MGQSANRTLRPTRWRRLAAIAALLAAPVSAQPAEMYTFRAGQIRDWCARETFSTPAQSEQFHFCMGYIIAVVEAHLTARERRADPSCLPAGVYGSKFVDMAVHYLKRQPDRMREPAPTLILDALVEAYPACR